MTRFRATLVGLLAILLVGVEPSRAQSGFDRAIASVLPRSVKLYGVKVGRQAGYGSGTIVSADGHVLTVYTLLLESNKLRVVTADGIRYGAELVTFDRETQLALIKMTRAMQGGTEPESLPFFDVSCPLGADAGRASQVAPGRCDPELLPGDWVLAAGNPFKIAEGAEPASVAHGVYSARTGLDARRKVKEFPYHGDVLVIDAVTSNPGAPGSPVVNLDGEFVGIIGRIVVSNLTHTKFNYAIPSDVIRGFLANATSRENAAAAGDAEGSATANPTSGDDFARVDPGIRLTRTGYMRLPPFVERVRRGSPAAAAGVRKDDLILSIDGHSVPDLESYDKRMSRVRPGDPIDLVIQRKKTVITIRIAGESATEER